MSERSRFQTISLRERSLAAEGADERLRKWFIFSLLLHVALIAGIFLAPMLPSQVREAPVYTVDLVGGEKIGRANFGTELATPPKQPAKKREDLPAAGPKKEVKKEEPPKEEKTKAKPVEKKPPPEEETVLREKSKTDPVKREPAKETKKEAKETKEDSKTEAASADSVRERLLQSAVDRAKTRTEAAQKSPVGEALSAGAGEGEGAAAIGVGGRGGPGTVRGMDFMIYQNRLLATIKENWAWVGQRSNLKVVVHFGVRETGEIVGLKIVQPSGDPSYDESVLRAVKKSSPLPAPPENYRKDFADVELTFRPRDLGA